MIPEYPWFERRFSFDLPAWMFPNVVERLRGTPARLEEALGSLTRQTLIYLRGEEWSIQENAGHLWDIEALWVGRLDDFLMGQTVLRPADVSNQKTDQADHNAGETSPILAAFRRERLAFVHRLDELGEANVGLSALHPRLNQPMRLIDHAFFAAEHDDHHLAQISRLKRLLRH